MTTCPVAEDWEAFLDQVTKTPLYSMSCRTTVAFRSSTKLYTAKIGKTCYMCTQLGGLAEWFIQIDTSQSMIEVDMPYTMPEIGPSKEGATDRSAKDGPKDSSHHEFHHIKQHSY